LQTVQTTYPPLDALKPVADSVWIVDSGPVKAMGLIPLPIRMTVLRLTDGSVVLHSPTRYDPLLHHSLEQIGLIRHLIAPNSAHWMFVKQWQDNCSAAQTWAAPGVADRRTVKKARVRLDHELGSVPPAAWLGEVDQIIVEGLKFAEVALLHKPSRSLILTDLVQNLEPEKMSPALRLPARLAGVLAPKGKAPIYLRAVVKMRSKQARQAAGRLLQFEPKFVIFSHGQWFDDRATERLRESLGWLVD